MAGGSHKRPPYEVMGDLARRRASGRRPGGTDEAEAEPDPSASAAETTAEAGDSAGPSGAARLWQWAASRGAPLTLRVPRGLAAAVVTGVLGLLVLAWWVGYVQGEHAAETRFERGLQGQAARMQQGPPTDAGGAAAGSARGEQVSGGAGQSTAATGDGPLGQNAREAGLNYDVLLTCDLNRARDLAAFYRSRGVAIHLENLDNNRAQVWVVGQGYRPSALASDNRPKDPSYIERVIELGKQYARQHEGIAPAELSQPQMTKYQGDA